MFNGSSCVAVLYLPRSSSVFMHIQACKSGRKMWFMICDRDVDLKKSRNLLKVNTILDSTCNKINNQESDEWHLGYSSVQTVSKTVWNCNRDNIVITSHIVPGQAFGQKPAVWILQMLHQLIGLFSAHLKLQNDGPSKHLASSNTDLLQLMCRRLTRLSSWQVYLHACLWLKVHRPNPQTGTQIAYSIQVFFHVLPFVMAKPPWPSPELPHYQNLPIPALQSAGSSPTALEISCRIAESVRKCCGTGHPKFWPTLQCADQTKQVDVAG